MFNLNYDTLRQLICDRLKFDKKLIESNLFRNRYLTDDHLDKSVTLINSLYRKHNFSEEFFAEKIVNLIHKDLKIDESSVFADI